jgi:glycosyltransferase involved in cell wall biosynthesis
MATVSERASLLRQAVKYFLRQTQSDTELIIVGEGAGSFDALFPAGAPIRHLPTSSNTNLGEKLNLGIEAARGSIIQKLDDDDYYHPEFLATMVSAVEGRSPNQVLAGIDCCPVLITQTGDLKWTGHGRFAGGTLCFPKQLWRQCPFRDVARNVDKWFLEDHDFERVRVCRPGLYIYVRHRGTHLWTHRGDQDVVEYYLQQPDFWQPLEELMAPDDVRFYRKLQTLETSTTGS